MAANQNLSTHYRGDTWGGIDPIIVHLNGSPLDLTDASIIMDVRKSKRSSFLAIRLSTENGDISIVDAANGSFKVEPKIINIEAGTYYFDIEITLSSGRVVTIVEGTWEIEQDITKNC